jgi:hypothetical protein
VKRYFANIKTFDENILLMEAKPLDYNRIEFLRDQSGIGKDEFAKRIGYGSRQAYDYAMKHGSISGMLPQVAAALEMDFHHFTDLLDVNQSGTEEERARYFRTRKFISYKNEMDFLRAIYDRREMFDKLHDLLNDTDSDNS